MDKYVDKLKQLGYSFALKGWGDGKDNKRYTLIIWKPENVKDTTITIQGDNAPLLFKEATTLAK